MADDDIAISVQNVSKAFKLPHEKQNSLKGALINIVRGGKRSFERQEVLKDVSFEVKKGEFLGIVGRNGSGKSTMLKLLAGIYSPSKGHIQVTGKLTPFIELGVGFNPELTGRENVFLNGALLGFSRPEIRIMYPDIVDFAELEKFMDQKLKNYSSGMQVRLAFSIAIRARSDILLLDEVLAVGDADFQRKCLQYFKLLKRDKKTVVFVSHDMESVRKFCDRVILLDNGTLTMDGPAQAVIPEFMSRFVERVEGTVAGQARELPLGMSSALTIDESVISIGRVWLEGGKSKSAALTEQTAHFDVCFEIKAKQDVANIVPGVTVVNDLGEFIIAANSRWGGHLAEVSYTKGKKYVVRFRLQNIFEQGNYRISVNVVSDSLDVFYDWKNHALPLLVTRDYATGGKAVTEYEVTVEPV